MKTAIQELIEQLEQTITEVKNGNALDKAFWLAKEKAQLISMGYMQIQYIEAEIGDCIYKKLPEEIYTETFTQK